MNMFGREATVKPRKVRIPSLQTSLSFVPLTPWKSTARKEPVTASKPVPMVNWC